MFLTVEVAILFSYQLKGRKYMTELMETEFSKEMSKLKQKYENADFVALTADTWSSSNQSKHFLR